jgi:hypothetical protein
MDLDFPDLSAVKGISVQRPVDVILHVPRQQRATNPSDHNEHKRHNGNDAQPAAPPALGTMFTRANTSLVFLHPRVFTAQLHVLSLNRSMN